MEGKPRRVNAYKLRSHKTNVRDGNKPSRITLPVRFCHPPPALLERRQGCYPSTLMILELRTNSMCIFHFANAVYFVNESAAL